MAKDSAQSYRGLRHHEIENEKHSGERRPPEIKPPAIILTEMELDISARAGEPLATLCALSNRQLPHASATSHPPRLLRESMRSPKWKQLPEGEDRAGGVGHNMPQEAPQAFAQAVVDVDSFS